LSKSPREKGSGPKTKGPKGSPTKLVDRGKKTNIRQKATGAEASVVPPPPRRGMTG